MKRPHRLLILFVMSCLLGAATSISTWAAEPTQNPEEPAVVQAAGAVAPLTVQITAVQTHGATASDELIELTNPTDEPIDITGWQVRYRNAAATLPGSTAVATITAAESEGLIILQEHEKFVLHTASVILEPGVRGQQYTARLSDADKTIGLFAPDTEECRLMVTATYTIGSNPQQLESLSLTDCAIPSATQPQPTKPTASPPGTVDSPASTPATPIVSPQVTEPTEPTLPARNTGLYAPQISELLPNPAKPGLDATDEFIELYNPNDAIFELSGFVLEAGSKTKKRYTFAAGTLLQPKSFVAFYSKDTKLTLSNTTSQVWLLDPLGRQIGTSEAYQTAKDGYAWLIAEGKWQWTAKPTPGALNALQTPAPSPKKKTAATSSHTTAKVKAATTSGTPHQTATTAIPAETAGATAHDDGASGGFNPLHPAVLALTGVVAVSYGIYEYRRDLANKYHQFRANRAARRAARQSLAGRGSPGASE